MNFPLGIWDIGLLIALFATILVVTSEVLSSYSTKVTIRINKKRLKNAAILMAIAFSVTIALRIASMIIEI